LPRHIAALFAEAWNASERKQTRQSSVSVVLEFFQVATRDSAFRTLLVVRSILLVVDGVSAQEVCSMVAVTFNVLNVEGVLLEEQGPSH